MDVLNDLCDGGMSMEKAIKKCNGLKQCECTKTAFLAQVELLSWDEGLEIIPDYADEEKLLQFNVKANKELPSDFKVAIFIGSGLCHCSNISQKCRLIADELI